STVWDANLYLKFADARMRPALDLMGRLDPANAARPGHAIYDLGCGAGNIARILAERFPGAPVVGIDSSEEMLAKARSQTVDKRVSFAKGDLAHFKPDAPPSILYSNAAYQWLAGHIDMFPGLMKLLPSDGQLAIQMPRNHEAPSHALMHEAAKAGPWRDKLKGIGGIARVEEPARYFDVLKPLSSALEVWEAIYQQAGTRGLAAYAGREAAPAGATPTMFLHDGRPRPLLDAVASGLSVGVPGAVALLEMAHREHGKLPWADLFTSSIGVARKGFPVSPRLAFWLETIKRLGSEPAARTIYFNEDGSPKKTGERIANPALAGTMERIAAEGARVAPGYIAERRKLISEDKSMGEQGPVAPGYVEHGTSHMTIVDRAGNAVAFTTTIEGPFGAQMMVGGFILNNELTDFSEVAERDG